MTATVNVRRRMLTLSAAYMSVLLAIVVSLGALGLRVRAATVEAATQIVPEQLAIRQLRSGAIDMQTGIRGYVISAEATFLKPYDLGRGVVRNQLAELRRIADDAELRRLLASFEQRLGEWQATADPLLALVRAGDVAEAIRLVKTSSGRLAFDRVRSALDATEAVIDARVAANRRVVSDTQGQLLAGAVVLSILTLLLGWASARTIRSWSAKDRLVFDGESAVATDELRWLASLNAMTEKLNRAETVASVALVLDREAARAFGAHRCGLEVVDKHGRLAAMDMNDRSYDADYANALLAAVTTGAYATFGAALEAVPGNASSRSQPIPGPHAGGSGVAVPLFSGLGYVRGAMSVLWSHPVTIDIGMRSRLETVAVLCSETIRRAELLDSVTAMAAISETLSNAVTHEDVQQIVATWSCEPFGASASVVLTAQSGELRMVERPDLDESLARRYGSARPDVDSPASVALRTGRLALAVNSDELRGRYPDLIDDVADFGTNAELAIPIEVGGTVVAIVALRWIHAIDEVAVRATAATFATLVAAAWSRAEMSRSTISIARLANRLTSSTTVNELTDAFVEFGLPAVGATSGMIATFDADANKDRVEVRVASVGVPMRSGGEQSLPLHDPAPIVAAVRSGRAVTATTSIAAVDVPLGVAAAVDAPSITTTAIPMRSSAQQVIGAVGYVWAADRQTDSVRLAKTIADMCAQTLDRTRLVDQDHRRVTALAGRLFGHHEAPRGMDIATRYVPSFVKQFVGGDWFEIVQLSGDRFAAVVGDVVGHGVEAAADMAQLKTLIGTLLRMGVDCDELFQQLGPLLEQGQTQTVFGTAAVVELRPFDGSLKVSTAGHPPVLMWRPGHGAEVCVGSRYPMLGVPALKYAKAGLLAFDPGSVVVLYTDGLVERRRETLDVGIERIRLTLENVAHRSVEAIADALIATAADSDHSDDVALVVIRNTMSSASLNG